MSDSVEENAKTLFIEGLQAFQDKKFLVAEKAFQKALLLMPERISILTNLAATQIALKKFNDARKAATYALSIEPNSVENLVNVGLIEKELKNFNSALLNFERAAELSPDYFEAWMNKGGLLNELNQYSKAIICHEIALKLNPISPQALSNYGIALKGLDRKTEAMSYYEKAIDSDSNYAEAWVNRGILLAESRRFSDAIISYNKAIEIDPIFMDAVWNRSLANLTLGNFELGWRDFECRWQIKNSPLILHASIPLLNDLTGINGKNIIVWSEQGLGDTLQFSRYINCLVELGANVLFESQEPLLRLLRGQFRCTVGALGSSVDADFQVPLMSLPFLFKTTVATIPANIPYLYSNPLKRKSWRDKLVNDQGFKVGLVWSGGFRKDQPELWDVNERRNIPLSLISILQEVGDVTFYSLQKGEPAESELLKKRGEVWPTNNLINHVAELRDFSDTAALIDNLDLVIAVDTSTAHLAGAMGKPVWLLNRFDSCWRWLDGREDTPWYPTMRLYNQKSAGDWNEVIGRVKNDLEKLVVSKTSSYS